MTEATVIIAAFGAEGVIERSVASALAQTVNVEAIVADDCSYDSTAAVVSRIESPKRRRPKLELPVEHVQSSQLCARLREARASA